MRVAVKTLVQCLGGLMWLLEQAHCTQNVEGFLQDALFADYNYKVRPRRNPKETVKLTLKLYVENIEYLDEKEQQMMSSGTMLTKWYDDFLVWNASDYEGIRTLYVPQDMIWIPDMYHPQGDPSYLTQEPRRHNLIVVHSDGLIKKYDVGFLRTKCPIDITYFPFDRQECTIEVSMLASAVEHVQIAEMEDAAIYAKNGFWKIQSTTAAVVNDSDYDAAYSKAWVKIKLVRSPQVYVYFLVVPILLLSALSLLVFCIPVEAGEKVGLSISVLLSFTIFQAMLADIMPAGSIHMPYIAQYNTAAFIIACMCLVATIVVVRVHHKTTDVPPRWKKIVLRLHSTVDDRATSRPHNDLGNPSNQEDIFSTDNDLYNADRRRTSMSQNDPGNPSNQEDVVSTDNDLYNDDRRRSAHLKPVDWPMVARLLDQIFFAGFTTISVAISLLNATYFLLYLYK